MISSGISFGNGEFYLEQNSVKKYLSILKKLRCYSRIIKNIDCTNKNVDTLTNFVKEKHIAEIIIKDVEDINKIYYKYLIDKLHQQQNEVVRRITGNVENGYNFFVDYIQGL